MAILFKPQYINPGAAILTDADGNAGVILGLRPANERQRYFVMMSLIGWVQA